MYVQQIRVCNKISKGIGILVRIRTKLNADILVALYLSSIQLYLECCNIILASQYTVHLIQLFIKQKKAIQKSSTSIMECTHWDFIYRTWATYPVQYK